MKKYFKKMARYFVTIYANRTFRKAMKVADSWRAATGKRYYVITHPLDDTKLVSIDTSGWINLRREVGISSKKWPIAYLQSSAWYYTVNNEGRDKISARDLEIRRLAFVREVMGRAGLLD